MHCRALLDAADEAGFGVGLVAPGFGVRHIAVYAHYREEHAGLNPAYHAFLICLVGVLIARTEETACIVGPPWHTCSRVVESAGYLTAQAVHVVAYIAAPHHDAIALHSAEGAAGEDGGGAWLVVGQKSVVHGVDDFQWIYVAIYFAWNRAVGHEPVTQVVVLGFGSIEPPHIDVVRFQQLVAEVLPVECGCIGVEEIDPVGAVDVVAAAAYLFSEGGVDIYFRPYRQHELHIHGVELAGHGGGVGVAVFVELHGIPSIFAPILPVLHDDVEGYAALLKLACVVEQFGLGVVAFAAVYVSQHVVEHGWSGAGEFAI